MTALDQLQASDFSAHQGVVFPVKVGDVSWELVLRAVKVLGHRRPEASREPFALEFTGPVGARLAQSIVQLQHPTLGVLEIFITQVGMKPEGSQFEAIFT